MTERVLNDASLQGGHNGHSPTRETVEIRGLEDYELTDLHFISQGLLLRLLRAFFSTRYNFPVNQYTAMPAISETNSPVCCNAISLGKKSNGLLASQFSRGRFCEA